MKLIINLNRILQTIYIPNLFPPLFFSEPAFINEQK